jgi:hypothetical protein
VVGLVALDPPYGIREVTMTVLMVRYMEEDWFEPEIQEIADLLLSVEIRTVYLSYGYGCDTASLLQTEDIPVPTESLAQFIADSEDRGVFRLGECDLKVRSGVGKAEFLLCHEHDIHFSGVESPLLSEVRFRWAKKYLACYESRDGGKWRSISVPNRRGEKF